MKVELSLMVHWPNAESYAYKFEHQIPRFQGRGKMARWQDAPGVADVEDRQHGNMSTHDRYLLGKFKKTLRHTTR